MKEIRMVYIDDNLDISISKYLNKDYKNDKFKLIYEEVVFGNNDSYEDLIQNTKVNEANIILIDSKLFENNNAKSGKFSGEEFKMILKKVFPFIEVIVITQNDLKEEYGTIQKYKKCESETATEFYNKDLRKYIDYSIKNICIYRNIADKLKLNNGIDKALIEKILNSLEGKEAYDELKKNDIDEIIKLFNELQENLNV